MFLSRNDVRTSSRTTIATFNAYLIVLFSFVIFGGYYVPSRTWNWMQYWYGSASLLDFLTYVGSAIVIMVSSYLIVRFLTQKAFTYVANRIVSTVSVHEESWSWPS